MTLRVEVTDEDIKLGEPDQADTCPIALALKRLVPGCEPWVEMTVFSLRGPQGVRYPLPAEAQDFIEEFDSDPDEGVAPAAFDLDIPYEAFPAS